MSFLIYAIIITGVGLFIIVPLSIWQSFDIYFLIIRNVDSAFNVYSKFKRDFLVLKKERYKFYMQSIVVFGTLTSLYIGMAFLMTPDYQEFFYYIISISVIYFICLIEIFVCTYFLVYKKIRRIKFLSKEEALEQFESLRQEFPKDLSYQPFEIKDLSKVSQVDNFFKRGQKYLKRKIAKLNKNDDDYKKLKVFFWYLRANGYICWSYLKNPLNFRITIDQNTYEANKIPEILMENFFALLNIQELNSTDVKPF